MKLMFKNCTLVVLLVFFTAFTFTRSNAQSKIAYINMQQLIVSMPETKRAYDTLQLYEQELAKDGEALVKEFNLKVEEFKKNEPTLKPDIRDLKLKELETGKASIEEYKARMDQKLAGREQALTAPIVAKARKTVADLAAEKGYVCVLDSSKDILVAATCEDLLAPAKQKMGIK